MTLNPFRWWHLRSCRCCQGECPYDNVGCIICFTGGMTPMRRASLERHRTILVEIGGYMVLPTLDSLLAHPNTKPDCYEGPHCGTVQSCSECPVWYEGMQR